MKSSFVELDLYGTTGIVPFSSSNDSEATAASVGFFSSVCFVSPLLVDDIDHVLFTFRIDVGFNTVRRHVHKPLPCFDPSPPRVWRQETVP